MNTSKPNVLRQDFWQDLFKKKIVDFIKLKTFLEGNILGVKLMILDLKKTKMTKICQFTFNEGPSYTLLTLFMNSLCNKRLFAFK